MIINNILLVFFSVKKAAAEDRDDPGQQES